jgi:hypothetical protein
MRLVSPLIEYLFASKKMKQVGSYEGSYTKSVYMPFTSNALIGTSYYMAPDPILNSVNNEITAIELVDSVTNATAPTVPATDPLSTGQAAQGYFYFCNMNREVIASIPLYSLIRRLNSGKVQFCNFDDTIVWQNCFVQFDSLGTAITTANSVWLRVTYTPIEN